MIIYNVTVNVEAEIQNEWLRWMKEVHIPEVMATGIFSEYRILRVLGDEESGGFTYAIQYTCAGMDDFRRYEKEFASGLRAETIEKFKDRFVAFRTLLETVA